MSLRDQALAFHAAKQGKIQMGLSAELNTLEELSLAYTPGVAEVCKEIQKNPDALKHYTCAGRMVAVITDGSAVLGLGNIGAPAGMPVMEGKCALFKRFAGVDAVPILINTQDPQQIVETVERIADSFAGINLEDIAAPNCFWIEKELRSRLSIPVFHDDQHGTAVVTLAGLYNALDVTGRTIGDSKIVVCGSGAGGVATTKLLLAAGAGLVCVVDSKGLVTTSRDDLSGAKQELAELTQQRGDMKSLAEVLEGADVFIGLSRAGTLHASMVHEMAREPIVMALANPTPEIMPEDALAAGAAVVATGRSDYINQINNALVFPGIFKGLLASGQQTVSDQTLVAAAQALAAMVEEPTAERIIPGVFDEGVADAIANAVMGAIE